jgi:hypothetical protein
VEFFDQLRSYLESNRPIVCDILRGDFMGHQFMGSGISSLSLFLNGPLAEFDDEVR